MRFADFATAGDAFFWLGKHSGCQLACCRPRIEIKRSGPSVGTASASAAAPALPPELMCSQAEDDDDDDKPALERCAYAVFDTETTGFSGVDVVLQCALGLFDGDGRLLQAYDRLWKLPPGVKIAKRAYEVHKIGYRRLARDGMDAAPQVRIVLRTLRRLRERRVPLVAHNAAFDVRLLQQTATAHGVNEWDIEKRDVLCTMQTAKPYTNLVSKKTGKLKAPSNVELYRHLHKRSPQLGALHDALVDVRVTAACYAAGRGRGWWR